MDLKAFVGKKVLLQFKPGVAYAVVTQMDGRLAPLMMKAPEGPPQPVIVPYIDGKVEVHHDTYFVVYGDQAVRGRKMMVSVDPELVGFVTIHGEEQTASPVILAP